MSARDLIEGEAELDDEENDESFDEETGEVRKRTNGVNGHLTDSSEEEEDDDDEDAARAVSPQPWFFDVHYVSRCTDISPVCRSGKALSSMRTRNLKSGIGGDAKGRSVGEKSAKRKKPIWMRRTST